MKLHQIEDAHQEAQFLSERRKQHALRDVLSFLYRTHLAVLRAVLRVLR